MKRSRVERLKELFDSAFDVVRSEWDFGDFIAQNDAEEKEAEEIFAELMTDWQPIETAPKDETFVLLACEKADSGFVIGFCLEHDGKWYESEDSSHSISFLVSPPTHWMPLPDPPKD